MNSHLYSSARNLTLAVTLAAFTITSAHAATVGLGTTKRGATSQISTAIASVVSGVGELKVRPQPMANTSQYIPAVNAGKLEFGIANAVQVKYAIDGKGLSEGHPNPDLRLVATLFPFRAGLVARKDAKLNSSSDLKGKTVPAFKEGSLGDYLMRGYLATGGLDKSSVTLVAVASFPAMFKSFKQGKIDVSIAAVGSGITKEFDATLGGIQYVNFPKAGEGELQKLLPGAVLLTVEANSEIPGLASDVNVMAYDYLLFAHKDVSDESVIAMLKGLHNNPDKLMATGPLWKSFDPKNMSKDQGVAMHPAASRFYKEMGQ
jgi:TRAP transporter TAXI family solute receptor